MKLVWLIVVVGCAAGPVGEVEECRGRATAACEEIGYGDNETCLLVFAKECSPEDALAAQESCCVAAGLPPGSECDLQWR